MKFNHRGGLSQAEIKGGLQKRTLDFHIAITLFVLLICVYSLTYSGTFITDDEHILASRTLSLAFDGNLNDQRVYGNQRIYALSDTTPVYAAQGVNIEPGQAFAGALLARLGEAMGVGRIQAIFLLNIWVTAFTAVLVFITVLFWGYNRFTALICALFFGLGTIAWPYTRTYFRDPLAMFWLSVAWMCMLLLVRGSNKKNITFILLIGLITGIVAGVLTKNTVLIAIPIMLFYILINAYKKNLGFLLKKVLKNNWKRNLPWMIGIIILWLILWDRFIPNDGVFARFTLNYYLFVIYKFFTTPHPNFLAALAGPLLSPGKSIFLYSPVLILSFIALFKKPGFVWPSWAFLFLLIIAQALFYDGEWWGHINWGLRFLVPTIPLLVIASAPVVERLLVNKKGWISLAIFGTISMFIQFIGVLAPIKQYYIEIFNTTAPVLDATKIWIPLYSPLFWNLKWILLGGSFDLAAIRVGIKSLPIILGFLTLLGFSIFSITRPRWLWLSGFSFFFSILLSVMMLNTYREDPAYFPHRNDLKAAQHKIKSNYLPNDFVIIKSYGTPAWYYWMNWSDHSIQWTALPYIFPIPSKILEYEASSNADEIIDEITLSLLKSLPSPNRRVWLVIPDDAPGATLNLETDWLKKYSNSSKVWIFTDKLMTTRLHLFNFTSIPD